MRPLIFLIFLSFFSTLFAGDEILSNSDYLTKKGSWTKIRKSEESSLRILIAILESTETGNQIIKKARAKAQEKGLSLFDIIVPSESSLTDTTLIRKFQADAPDAVTYETKSVVYLNRDLKPIDALLDLAHELTHFNERTAFNPYEQNFTIPEFVTSTIEGRGGEADAYLIECEVYRQLYPYGSRDGSNCDKIMEGKSFSKDKTVDYFYRVGKYNSYFDELVTKYKHKRIEFFKVKEDSAEFISSAYNLPYPVAAVFEYISIMERACHNDEKRLALMKSQVKGRTPASVSESGLNDVARRSLYETLSKSYQKRCEHHVNSDKISTIYSGIR